MREDEASRTAEVNALQRAAESRLPAERRLVEDPHAHLFVQRGAYRALLAVPPLARVGLRRLDARFPGLHIEIMLRARYVQETVRGGDFEQVVLLGAGYDSTALANPGLRVFEVDAPATQRAKRAVLERRGVDSPATFVPCNFETDSPAELLESAGLEPGRRTLTVWLGVSMYLTRDAFRSALEGVASWTAPGGTLVWDYMDPDVIDESTRWPGGQRAAEWVRKRGEPYLLGLTLDDARGELERAGFTLREHLRIPDLAQRFGPGGETWCSTDDWMGVIAAERT